MTQKLVFRGEKKMNIWFCKATLAAAVTSLTFVAAAPAQAEECSNASLKGKYAQTISGQLLPGPGVVLTQNGVAMTKFDGKGKFTQQDFVLAEYPGCGMDAVKGEYHSYAPILLLI